MLKGVVVVAILAVGAFLLFQKVSFGEAPHEKPTGRDSQRDLQEALVFTSRTGIRDTQKKLVRIPSPKADEILVKVAYAGVNPVDVSLAEKFVAPFFCSPSESSWCGLGREGTGEVVDVGRNVTRWKAGDKVVFRPLGGGSIAKFAVAKEEGAFRVPASGPWKASNAAGVPVVGGTAIVGLTEQCPLSGNGRSVLVLSGGSCVGSSVVHYAKRRGAYVITTCGTRSVEKCKNLGADLVIDYQKEPSLKEALAKRQISSVDIVFEAVDGEGNFDAIKFGCLVTCDLGNRPFRKMFNLFWKKVVERQNANFVALTSYRPSAYFPLLENALKQNLLPQLPTHEYTFDKAVDALEHVKESKKPGKVIIKVA